MRLLLFVLLIFLSCVPVIAAVDMSVSPRSIIVAHLKPGMSYDANLQLGVRTASFPIGVEIVADGILADYLSYPSHLEFLPGDNLQQVSVPIRLQLPETIDMGSYSGVLNFRFRRASSDQLSVVLDFPVPIDINVTDDDILAVEMDAFDMFQADDSLQMSLRIENSGNVPVVIDGYIIDFFNDRNELLLTSFRSDEVFTIAPFSNLALSTEILQNLPSGTYWAHLHLLCNACDDELYDEVVFETNGVVTGTAAVDSEKWPVGMSVASADADSSVFPVLLIVSSVVVMMFIVLRRAARSWGVVR